MLPVFDCDTPMGTLALVCVALVLLACIEHFCSVIALTAVLWYAMHVRHLLVLHELRRGTVQRPPPAASADPQRTRVHTSPPRATHAPSFSFSSSASAVATSVSSPRTVITAGRAAVAPVPPGPASPPRAAPARVRTTMMTSTAAAATTTATAPGVTMRTRTRLGPVLARPAASPRYGAGVGTTLHPSDFMSPTLAPAPPLPLSEANLAALRAGAVLSADDSQGPLYAATPRPVDGQTAVSVLRLATFVSSGSARLPAQLPRPVLRRNSVTTPRS